MIKKFLEMINNLVSGEFDNNDYMFQEQNRLFQEQMLQDQEEQMRFMNEEMFRQQQQAVMDIQEQMRMHEEMMFMQQQQFDDFNCEVNEENFQDFMQESNDFMNDSFTNDNFGSFGSFNGF